MSHTDLVFDLYGTLVDIHTDENAAVWQTTANFFQEHGAGYTGRELKKAYEQALERAQAQAGQSYECYPDIPFEQIMAALFRAKGVTENTQALSVQATKLFRAASTQYIRLYPHVLESLTVLREKGYRLWLLSNAQRVFIDQELPQLGLAGYFDGIFISSDWGCRKPDLRFFQALTQTQKLDPQRCFMIGNDRETDIAGAKNAGMATLYMHTNLTPAHQEPADPKLFPGNARAPGRHYEFEGYDWQELTELLCSL